MRRPFPQIMMVPARSSLRGRMPMRVLAAAAVAGLGLAGCGGPAPAVEGLVEDDDCRRTVLVGAPAAALDTLPSEEARQFAMLDRMVEWRLPPESADVAALNAWCAAVGPAVVGGWGDTAAASAVDTVWLVSWNLRVGGGDLAALVDDLRAGRLTGGAPAEAFVILLQEAYRGGRLVPTYDALEPGGSLIAPEPPSGSRRDVVALAEELGLWLVYVPSMRNGQAEDRGNALLSTLPLRDPVAIALPMARQRRVAAVATIGGRTSGGRDWRLQLASVHLESSPEGLRSDEAQRLEQAERLLELLPGSEAAVAAGDFNTKTRGQDAALVPVMLAAYPHTPPFPEGPTYRRAFGLYREYLDYIFFRLPDDTAGRVRRVPSTYGSDHFPLVGRVVW